MIAEGRYLCGCDPQDPRLRNYTTSIDPVTGELSFKRYDSQGFEVCPEHGKRLYGYNSITKQGPQGNNITDYNEMYLKMYGPEKSKKRELGSLCIADRRDNRDPQKIGAAFLSRKNAKIAKTNGKGRIVAKTKRPPMVIDEP